MDNFVCKKGGITMESPLGPVIAGIFMVELERCLLLRLFYYMKRWKCYVDDSIAYLKTDTIKHCYLS